LISQGLLPNQNQTHDMIALKVTHNGQPVCVAGVGDLGVITAIVTWVHSLDSPCEPDGQPGELLDLDLNVGCLHTPSGEHRQWDVPKISVGDNISVQVVETDDISPHAKSINRDQVDRVNEQEHVRKKAREYGWTILEPEAELDPSS
jgi:hypothetical protein